MKEKMPYYCWLSLPASQDPENLLTIPAMESEFPYMHLFTVFYLHCPAKSQPIWSMGSASIL
jgi:hypothetical protein